MKKLLLILTTFLLSAFCLPAQTCQLISKTEVKEGRTDVTTYGYDSKTKLLSEKKSPYAEGGHYEQTYHYYEESLSSIRTGEFYSLYFADDNGRIDGVIDYDDLNVSHVYHTMEYDAENRLIRYTTFETPYLEDTLLAEFTKYYYEGDKMVKRENYYDYPDSTSAPSNTTVFEYADHPNPEYNPVYAPLVTQKYVVAKETYSNEDGVYDEYSGTRECEYNKQGYPVKCVVRYPDGSEKSVETYGYKCK